MTLVQNRLLLLSGNKGLIFIGIGLLLAACSPKVRPVSTKPIKTPEKKKDIEVTVTPPPALPIPFISLILPFQLDELNLSHGAPKSELAKADVAVEFYQGFKLALDSLTARGQNFKLQVYDSKDEKAQAHSLALNPKIRSSSMVIGPVYPEGVKSFTYAFGGLKKILISPLSPTPPEDYKYPGLVTMIPPLEFHARKVAGYIESKLKAKTVFILKSGYSTESKYTVPFKRAIDSLGKKRIKVVILTVAHGNLSSLLPQLSKTDQNIFIIPSTDQQFLQVTMHSLDVLYKQHYPVTVFGHPNWEGVGFLKPDLLQRLNTYITSSDRVDYKSDNMIQFLKDYRKTYHAEPGQYAIKGFDEGMYFGNMAGRIAASRYLSSGSETMFDFTTAEKVLKSQDYEGLHNTFHFVNIPGQGYVNTHVQLYQYANFELKPVE